MTQPTAAAPDAAALPTWTLFEEPRWLDCVAPGGWRAAIVEQSGVVVGRLPYLYKPGPLPRLTVPPLTPWLGPCVRRTGAKAGNDLGHEHEVMEALIRQLPPASWALVPAPPENSNLLPFHWANFRIEAGYTYRLDTTTGESSLWAGLRENIRREIRKAQNRVTPTTEITADDLFGMIRKSFGRQGLGTPDWKNALGRIMALLPVQHRTLLGARDAEQRLHAALLFVHDHRHTFYLAGGADPELRTSGAQSLLMWEGIRAAVGRAPIFDFEGSHVRGVERFFRGFGATQAVRLRATRRTPMAELAQAGSQLFRAVRQRFAGAQD